MWRDVLQLGQQDMAAVYGNKYMVALSNRGFHALFVYRLANALHRSGVPLLPLVITRIIQILYSIDIDYRASIGGGVAIVHGMGTVIGRGAVLDGDAVIYHGVTLGIADRKTGDGYPHIARHVTIGAGAKLLGPVHVGEGAKVGANAVVVRDVPPHHVAVGIPARNIPQE